MTNFNREVFFAHTFERHLVGLSVPEQYTFWLFQKIAQKILRDGSHPIAHLRSPPALSTNCPIRMGTKPIGFRESFQKWGVGVFLNNNAKGYLPTKRPVPPEKRLSQVSIGVGPNAQDLLSYFLKWPIGVLLRYGGGEPGLFGFAKSRPTERSDQFFLAVLRPRKMKYSLWCDNFSLEKLKACFSKVWTKTHSGSQIK